jgi:NhaP-type Na+/H+ or K+/H+ antiporter
MVVMIKIQLPFFKSKHKDKKLLALKFLEEIDLFENIISFIFIYFILLYEYLVSNIYLLFLIVLTVLIDKINKYQENKK